MKIPMLVPDPSAETIRLEEFLIVEPLGLEILYALKRDSEDALIMDMILEKKPVEFFIKKFKPDVLCVTGYITNVSTMISYCEAAKSIDSHIKTVVGGVHCEVCPEDFEHDAVDFRVVRNDAKIFNFLLDHIDFNSSLPHGVLKKYESINSTSLPPFDFYIPFPDRDAVARYRKKYFYIFHEKVALIKTSFGCPFLCSFCFCRIITEGRYSQRKLDDVINELLSIKEKEIYIVDDDFLVDRKWLQQFIVEINQKDIKKHFLFYGRATFIENNPYIIH